MSQLIKIEGPPYKNKMRKWLTKTLFKESSLHQGEYIPVFSLFQDWPGLINAQKTFVALEDPSGYKWAMMYLGSWAHWERLQESDWFRDAYEIWLRELSAKMKSKAIDVVLALAHEEGVPQATQLAAAKYIAEEAWDKPKAGRPTKEKIAGELKNAIKVLTVEDEDASRIGLKLVSDNTK